MKKGQKMSLEQRQKISKANKGVKKSEEHKKNISKNCKGRKVWNKGKGGYHIHSEEYKKIISERFKGRVSPMKGKKQSKHFHEVMDGKEPWNKGTKGIMKSNKTSFEKGHETWIKGKEHTEETKKKMSDTKRKLTKTYKTWKGDKAKYGTKHDWVRTRKGRARDYKCEICKIKQANDWSNKNHEYKRNLKDWQAVCKKCHYKFDKDNNNK